MSANTDASAERLEAASRLETSSRLMLVLMPVTALTGAIAWRLLSDRLIPFIALCFIVGLGAEVYSLRQTAGRMRADPNVAPRTSPLHLAATCISILALIAAAGGIAYLIGGWR